MYFITWNETESGQNARFFPNEYDARDWLAMFGNVSGVNDVCVYKRSWGSDYAFIKPTIEYKKKWTL